MGLVPFCDSGWVPIEAIPSEEYSAGPGPMSCARGLLLRGFDPKPHCGSLVLELSC